MTRFPRFFVLILFLAGCSRSPSAESKPAIPEADNAATRYADGLRGSVTGAAAARDKANQATAERNAQFQEIP